MLGCPARPRRLCFGSTYSPPRLSPQGTTRLSVGCQTQLPGGCCLPCFAVRSHSEGRRGPADVREVFFEGLTRTHSTKMASNTVPKIAFLSLMSTKRMRYEQGRRQIATRTFAVKRLTDNVCVETWRLDLDSCNIMHQDLQSGLE